MMRSTIAASFAAIIICTANLSSDIASAFVAGEVAARTKLTEKSSFNKKRSFGYRKGDAVEYEEYKHGECNWTTEDIYNFGGGMLFLYNQMSSSSHIVASVSSS